MVVDAMIAASGREIIVEVDSSRLRAGDISRIVGSSTKLSTDTGWRPRSTAIAAAVRALKNSTATL